MDLIGNGKLGGNLKWDSCLVVPYFVCSDDLSHWESVFLAKPRLKLDWKKACLVGNLNWGLFCFIASPLYFINVLQFIPTEEERYPF